ncbi:MAG: YiiD C-terminal domain-containing protein [Thermodesulfovibrionales bacterium]|nr:YiiD C-terminal domain-containing protein [Thermodesulfovibrionales bacterium]
MEVTEIPFNKYLELTRSKSDINGLELSIKDNLKNHLGTFHASAQFALAEACSGQFLLNSFPELSDSVIPVLRKSEVKFKNPANESIIASAQIAEKDIAVFESQFKRKGRATIIVQVVVREYSGNITMTGSFQWFVQRAGS